MSRYRLLCAFIAVVALFLGGCGNFITPELGVVAKKESRILIKDLVDKDAVFQTGDLKLNYSLVEMEGEYRYAGVVDFDRSLTDSFSTIVKFCLKMSFLDSEGRVLETVDVTPFFSYLNNIPLEMKIKKDGITPYGASAIVFNYLGLFRGATRDITEDWEIIYFPFE